MFNTGLATRMIRVTSGGNPDNLRLQIEDDISGTLLAELNLNPAEVWEVLRGGSIEVTGRTASTFDRVGKPMISDHITVPPEVLKGVAYSDMESVAEAWARQTHPEWESYDPRRRGGTGGMHVVVRKWVS